ncbi:thioredoxin family protein [Paraflavitalea sp. CAU 1676]|uniref:thioredoxin family protein n=1 Tax=Paraflavitalea sp. CAU 1676 TaxID=3032598 RepID=UPI0023D9BD07|nr:thioredoxin family protein [Paraflavitalea sp. CAU 1676]MDF2191317.1 thioredoxin family protein [Paraflavitalea sp. CAU 1676]
MKQLIVVLLLGLSTITNAQTATITPGTKAPEFELKNVDGKTVSFKKFGNVKGYIVVFTCNTCPYAKAYEQRIIELNTKYTPLGFPVIAINPNDPEVSPGDSYEKMAERAKSNKYEFPYLFDEGQKITAAYGAKNTPHIFLVKHTKDGNIISYTGSIDNDPENNKADKTNYLEHAIAAVTSGKDPELAITKAIGCTVRRKKQ